MRSISTIAHNIVTVAAQRQDRVGLVKAHEAAAEFHEAIAEAIEAQIEIEDTEADLRRAPNDQDYREFLREHRRAYQTALGRACIALQKTPVKWAGVLEAELDAVQSAVHIKVAAE